MLKRYQLHFVLDVSLHPLQLGSVMRKLWPSIGHQFWKQRNNTNYLSKYFPQHRIFSPLLLDHDLYNPSYHKQVMNSTFVMEGAQPWSDFEDYNNGIYPKQNQQTHGYNFIPKHGMVPNLSATDAK